MLLVDTNVLIDVLENDPVWADWSIGQLRDQSQVHDLLINPIVYAEVSLAFESLETLEHAIGGLQLEYRELPRPALFLAGKAFAEYRRLRGGSKSVLPDFFIGAHAAVLGCGILTRDTRRYRSYFKTVALVAPPD